MVATAESLVGIGVYSPNEAARLLKTPVRTLRRWVDGYTYRVRAGEQYGAPVISPQLPHPDETEILTFLDLMELYFIARFRREGVDLRTIRDAAERLAERYATDHPFATEQFFTDGRRIFADWLEKKTGDRLTEELAKRQLVFDQFARPFFREVDFDFERRIRRYWPLGKRARVVLDPTRHFGKPIDSKTGVPTWALYQAVDGGESEERVAAWYDVPVAAVARAVEYEGSLIPA